jgi:hypothetical protein
VSGSELIIRLNKAEYTCQKADEKIFWKYLTRQYAVSILSVRLYIVSRLFLSCQQVSPATLSISGRIHIDQPFRFRPYGNGSFRIYQETSG